MDVTEKGVTYVSSIQQRSTAKLKTMKKLRISQDYVAVDVVNERDEIIDTPIYLTINKPKQLLWFDVECKIWMQTTATYTKNGIECRDSDGLVWVSVVEELLTQARPVHHAVKPGDSD